MSLGTTGSDEVEVRFKVLTGVAMRLSRCLLGGRLAWPCNNATELKPSNQGLVADLTRQWVVAGIRIALVCKA